MSIQVSAVNCTDRDTSLEQQRSFILLLETTPPTWEYCFNVMNILSYYTAYRRKLHIHYYILHAHIGEHLLWPSDVDDTEKHKETRTKREKQTTHEKSN
jgi:hypothetical protein